jgi:hypothetical protein
MSVLLGGLCRTSTWVMYKWHTLLLTKQYVCGIIHHLLKGKNTYFRIGNRCHFSTFNILSTHRKCVLFSDKNKHISCVKDFATTLFLSILCKIEESCHLGAYVHHDAWNFEIQWLDYVTWWFQANQMSWGLQCKCFLLLPSSLWG